MTAQRLPAIQRLSAELHRKRVARKTTAADSVRFLQRNHPALAGYSWPEELARDAYRDVPDPVAQKLAWHLGKLRGVLLDALWRREVFVGASVLDELLFYDARRDPTTDPIAGVLRRIRDARLTRPGLILFPLHGFGIAGAGLAHWATSTRISVIEPEWGLAVSPQTNSMELTLQYLDTTRRQFGISEAIPEDLIEHWHRSRGAEWLERNPLLAVRTVQAPGGYYENEAIVLARVKTAAAILAMLAILQPDGSDDDASTLFSSSNVNNWQTLDIHHYVALYVQPGSHPTLTGDCVPIHLRPAVTEIAELDVDIDSKYWTKRRQRHANAVEAAVREIYRGYLQYAVLGTDDAHARTYRKLFESLSYLTRSLASSSGGWRETISLATAFEMLLTDSYEPPVARTLQRRVRTLLRGTPGTTEFQQSVVDMYHARNEIVHSGHNARSAADLRVARAAFVHAFISLSQRLSSLNRRSTRPLADLLGD